MSRSARLFARLFARQSHGWVLPGVLLFESPAHKHFGNEVILNSRAALDSKSEAIPQLAMDKCFLPFANACFANRLLRLP